MWAVGVLPSGRPSPSDSHAFQVFLALVQGGPRYAYDLHRSRRLGNALLRAQTGRRAGLRPCGLEVGRADLDSQSPPRARSMHARGLRRETGACAPTSELRLTVLDEEPGSPSGGAARAHASSRCPSLCRHVGCWKYRRGRHGRPQPRSIFQTPGRYAHGARPGTRRSRRTPRMSGQGTGQLLVYAGVLLVLAYPLGALDDQVIRTVPRAPGILGVAERGLLPARPDRPARGAGLARLRARRCWCSAPSRHSCSTALLRVQGHLDLNPDGMKAMPPHLAAEYVCELRDQHELAVLRRRDDALVPLPDGRDRGALVPLGR